MVERMCLILKIKKSGLNNKPISSKLFDIFNLLFMLLICFITLYPFLYVLATSMSSNIAVMQNKVTFYPVELNFTAYKKILKDPYLVSSYYNTIKYTLIGTFINLLFTSTMAYPLSRKKLVFKGFFNTMIVITMFFGGGLIPTFLLVNSLGMYDTIWAIVIPGAISTYYLIIMRTFFQSIPAELEESAKIDGAGSFRTWLRIALPLTKTAMLSLTMISIVWSWNDYLNPLIYLKSESLYTITLGLLRFIDETGKKYSLIMAACVSATILPIILFLFGQKYFIEGLTSGAVKG